MEYIFLKFTRVLLAFIILIYVKFDDNFVEKLEIVNFSLSLWTYYIE